MSSQNLFTALRAAFPSDLDAVAVETDDATGLARSISPVRLGGRLVDMGYDAADQAVVVRFEAVRSTRGGAVETRRFESVVPGVPAKPAAIAPALNRAANAVAADVAAWIG